MHIFLKNGKEFFQSINIVNELNIGLHTSIDMSESNILVVILFSCTAPG